MVKDKITHWITLSNIKQYYLVSLDQSLELTWFYTKEEFDKLKYKPEEPTLKGLIKYCKEFNVPNKKTAIIGKNNNILKITNG